MPSSPPLPLIVALHSLGSSGREFDRLRDLLADDFELATIDLPGFGSAPIAPGTSVASMADAVLAFVRERHPERWLLIGHSLGGKVATAVAARLTAAAAAHPDPDPDTDTDTGTGTAPADGLAGIVLLAASPPSPEPMDDGTRRTMLAWAADGPLDAAAARQFIDANVGSPLDPAADVLAVADLLRTDPVAWTAWLTGGADEDLSASLGTLDLPALVVAGGADGPLGPEGQRAHNLPVYPRATLLVLDGAGHLLPLERPAEVAAAVRGFWDTLPTVHVASTRPPEKAS
ncbi:MAG: alpha/beta hydrolase [Herbiconiux sp.]|nr:alpha/beta hydrolase [Herbiconiux sp.]